MNDKNINDILEQVVKNVIEQLGCENTQTTSKVTSCESIPIELSARHAHLSEADALELFGHPLTPVRELSQPSQFLCEERVRLIGPKGVMDNVAVLGPARASSQIEMSKTDARTLGIDAPVRQSGDISGTPGIILASQTGIVGLEEGVIVAARHIHMSPEDAKRFGLADQDKVSVHLDTERPITLNGVLIRVDEAFKLAMHIDPDEGNCAGWNKSVSGRIEGC
ncbi:MAG: propanediol utilization protein [Desulfotalea sp.]|nr:MAG: propanediol utilization protein [Desulfotalea sp.]